MKGLISLFFALIYSQIHGAIPSNVIELMPDPYPQVYELSEVLPFNPHGWYGHHETFQKLIQDHQVEIAIEVGSWMGASARDIAKMLPPNGYLISVDTWLGSEEHQPGESFYTIPIQQLFHQFLSNTIHENLQHKIIPMRTESVNAAKLLASINFKADFIYIDAAHDYESIKADLYAWYPLLKEGGVFCGDDFHHPPIIQAVNEFAKEFGLKIAPASCWLLVKEN